MKCQGIEGGDWREALLVVWESFFDRQMLCLNIARKPHNIQVISFRRVPSGTPLALNLALNR